MCPLKYRRQYEPRDTGADQINDDHTPQRMEEGGQNDSPPQEHQFAGKEAATLSTTQRRRRTVGRHPTPQLLKIQIELPSFRNKSVQAPHVVLLKAIPLSPRLSGRDPS